MAFFVNAVRRRISGKELIRRKKKDSSPVHESMCFFFVAEHGRGVKRCTPQVFRLKKPGIWSQMAWA